MRVFTIWEPILFTDWMKPGARVLERLNDPRVVNYWDRRHVVAAQLARDAKPPQPEPECCTSKGILWDLVAVYPPGSLWSDTMPPAILFEGPVFHLKPEITKALDTLRR